MDKSANYKFHYVAIPPARQIGLHSQPTWELSYVLVGHGQRLIGNTKSEFREGDLVLVPPDVQHCWYFSPESTDEDGNIVDLSLQFSQDLLSRLLAIFPELSEASNRFLSVKDALCFTQTATAILGSKMLAMRDMDDIHRVSSLIDLLVTISEHIDESEIVGGKVECDTTRDRLMQIETFVACNYARHISLSEVASHLGMSRASFVSFVRKHIGETFISYLNEYRLLQAHYLLTHNKQQWPVSIIGYSVGFQSISHFNHLFKERYGCSPKQIGESISD